MFCFLVYSLLFTSSEAIKCYSCASNNMRENFLTKLRGPSGRIQLPKTFSDDCNGSTNIIRDRSADDCGPSGVCVKWTQTLNNSGAYSQMTFRGCYNKMFDTNDPAVFKPPNHSFCTHSEVDLACLSDSSIIEDTCWCQGDSCNGSKKYRRNPRSSDNKSMSNVQSASRDNSRNTSETSSIQDLLINVEANDLSSVVNEEVSITMSAPPSPETPRKIEFDSEIETPQSQGIRRRLTLKGSIGSDLENDPETPPARKPSRISYDERLTVICDSQTSSPLQTPSPSQERERAPFDDVFQPKGFFSFFWEELTRGYSLHNDQARFMEKRRKVYAFLRIPLELEQFLLYGLLQCTDAFFYLFTFLPLRFLMSVFGALTRVKRWTSAETCDFLKIVIILAASMLIREIDSSFLYHQVRSQGTIKLYIFYNMLEVADRLFSSLGQDIFDALLFTANPDKKRFSAGHIIRTSGHLIVAILYATLHSFLVILQATVLNVAFNSHSQTVLAIMMSNNFVELKGAVFKKFAKANLFQMACSDVRERFHIFALLFVVMIRNMTAVNWNVDSFTEMVPDILMVVGCEFFVDWLKHAFITKFNEINSEVYKDFTITIAFDVIRSREQNAFSDHSDQVSRRMGFIPIPLSIMIIRVLSQTFTLDNLASILIFVIGWLLLLAIKVCNGVIMLGQACEHVKRFRDIQARSEFELFRKRMVEKKSKSAPNSPRMSLIDFTDVLHQPAAGKGFTVSDMLSQWDELQPSLLSEIRRSTDRETAASGLMARSDDRTPRRAVSMAHIPRRDRSEPPPGSNDQDPPNTDADDQIIMTASSQSGTNSNSEQASPTKKKGPAPVSSSGSTATNTTSSDELADVTAYKMPEQGVQRIE
ncbi:unnamed protein product [Caenorhabditis brenneri]